MSSLSDLIAHARKHSGIVTLHEAVALGASRSSTYRWAAEGLIIQVGPGVFALPGTSSRPDITLRAACRALGAVVSHESAATVHRIGPVRERHPTVTVSHRGTHRFEGVVVRQSTDLMEQHVDVVDGLRVTNPSRTVIDLAAVVSRSRLEVIVDNVLAAGVVELNDLNSLRLSLSRQGKKGARNLRAVLESRVGDPAVPTTVLEARLLRLIKDAGLPIPTREFHAPWLKPINGRVDLAYVDHHLVIEADSRRWHLLFDAFEVDRRRDNAAQIAGWKVLRFTWRMIEEEPAQVLTTIKEALLSQRAPSSRG